MRVHERTPVTRFGAGSPAVAETPSGAVRAGAAVIALNAWAAHWKRFRRAITVRGSYIVLTAPAPERLRGDRLDERHGPARLPRRPALRAHHARRAHRVRHRRDAARTSPARSGRGSPTTRPRSRVAIADLHRMFPNFARRAGRGGLGRAHRRLRRAPALLRHPRRRHGARRSRVHGQRRGTGAPGRAHPGAPSARPRTTWCSTCRSSTSSRCGSRPSRSALRAHWSRTTRSVTRTSSRTAASSRTRSWTSWRSCPAGSATTSVPERPSHGGTPAADDPVCTVQDGAMARTPHRPSSRPPRSRSATARHGASRD